MKKTMSLFAALLLLFVFSCEKSESDLFQWEPVDDSPVFVDLSSLQAENARIGKAAPQNYALFKAEYLTASNSGEVGRTVYFKNVGNKQLDSHFVPGLQLDGTTAVSYYIDENRPTEELSTAVSSAAIQRAMQTWDEVICSDLEMYQVPSNPGIITGFVSAVLGFGGSFNYVADIVHCGWLPGAFFDLLAPGGSTYILGVTFTIIFVDENGDPVDTNNDHKWDAAFREIYYNDYFEWADGAYEDVETVALHEAGHGLSQGHFGTFFRDASGKKFHFSPKSVMNAGLVTLQTELTGTDKGGHCSIWANWPKK